MKSAEFHLLMRSGLNVFCFRVECLCKNEKNCQMPEKRSTGRIQLSFAELRWSDCSTVETIFRPDRCESAMYTGHCQPAFSTFL